MSGTDAELISHYASSRDAESFAELVSRYRDMVYSAAVSVVREPATAEDVTQECFLRLARSAASIRHSVAGWLHTVAVNASIDAVREERSRRRREEQAARANAHHEDEASWDEIKHEVHQAVERVPEELREPLVLHFLAGRPQSEVASELGMSQPTVSRRINEGVARLREHLKQAGVVVSASALGTLLGTQTAEAAPATLVAALGKLALAGIPSSPPSTGVVGSALARIAAVGWKAKLACVVTAAVVGGVAVHQAARSRSAASPPAVTQQTGAPRDTNAGVKAPQPSERADPSSSPGPTSLAPTPPPTEAAVMSRPAAPREFGGSSAKLSHGDRRPGSLRSPEQAAPATLGRRTFGPAPLLDGAQTDQIPDVTSRQETPLIGSRPAKKPDDAAAAPDAPTTIAALPRESAAQLPDDPESRVQRLIAQLRDPDPEVRRRAAGGLGTLAVGNSEIYVMNADGSGQMNLTNTPRADLQPHWSPDGRKIAFVSNHDGNREIYVMNADGSGRKRLTESPGDDANPTWSPDGSKIAFASARDGNFEIYVMNADGSGPRRLTHRGAHDNAPTWSPDGSRIAFWSAGGHGIDIWVMNANGSGLRTLTDDPGPDRFPAWSPDGSNIAFHSERGGNYDIYVINPDGSGETRLTDARAYDGQPAWSPDGRKIAFHSFRDKNAGIYVMNPDGSGQTSLTDHPGGDLSPTWSPDGSKIAFGSERMKVEDEALLRLAIPPLIEALDDEDGDVRSWGTEALGSLVTSVPDPAVLRPALAPLVGMLRDGDADGLSTALNVLGDVASYVEAETVLKLAVAPLAGMLEDEDPARRTVAVRALGRIASKAWEPAVADRTLSLLSAAMEDEHADVRRAAAEVLKKMGMTGLDLAVP